MTGRTDSVKTTSDVETAYARAYKDLVASYVSEGATIAAAMRRVRGLSTSPIILMEIARETAIGERAVEQRAYEAVHEGERAANPSSRLAHAYKAAADIAERGAGTEGRAHARGGER